MSKQLPVIYKIGDSKVTGKPGSAARWGQLVGEVVDGKKHTFTTYSNKKGDFSKGSLFDNMHKKRYKIEKISEAEWDKLKP